MMQPMCVFDHREPDGFDIVVPSGRLRAHRFGPAAGPVAICVPGISANSRWFDFLAEGLAADGRQVVALDLRARGYSSLTPPGTYGLRNHAVDVYDAARALGLTSFDYIGHSMGAYIGMEAGAMRAAPPLRKLVLIDGLGVPRYSAVKSILRAFDRLDRTYGSRAAYLEQIRNLGLIEHWNSYWERAYEYELVAEAGSVRSRTHRAPIFEDVAYGYAHDARRLWRQLQLPVLAIRAAVPMTGRTGHFVPACDLRNFAHIAPRVTTAEIAANHYDIIMHDQTLSAIRGFFDAD